MQLEKKIKNKKLQMNMVILLLKIQKLANVLKPILHNLKLKYIYIYI